MENKEKPLEEVFVSYLPKSETWYLYDFEESIMTKNVNEAKEYIAEKCDMGFRNVEDILILMEYGYVKNITFKRVN